MSNLLSTDFLLITLAFILIFGLVTTILYFKEYLERQKITNQEEKLVKDHFDKSFDLLTAAIAKSKQILGTAQDQSIQITSQAQTDLSRFENEYKLQLDQAIRSSEDTLTTQNQHISSDLTKTLTAYKDYFKAVAGELENTQKDYQKYISELKKKSADSAVLNEDGIKARIDKLFQGIEDHISAYLIQSDQRMMMAIELELKSARQLIDTYKVQQMNIIDENIVAILEKTIYLVLQEKLTLNDQLDLIYEALEKAKVEKFLV